MNPFLAILRLSIEKLTDNTPEARQAIYARARAVVQSRMAKINPPPSPDLIEAQNAKLDAAIREIENGYEG